MKSNNCYYKYTCSLALEKEILSTTPSYEYTRSGFYYIIMFSTKTAKNNCIKIKFRFLNRYKYLMINICIQRKSISYNIEAFTEPNTKEFSFLEIFVQEI